MIHVDLRWELHELLLSQRGGRATCGLSLFSSSQHYRDQGGRFAKCGREKIKISLCDSSLQILGQKKPKYCSKKKHWCVVLHIISVTFVVTNYHPIIERLCGCWWRCKHGSKKVWFLRDGLALAVCKHPREDTNHNFNKNYWNNKSFLLLD